MSMIIVFGTKRSGTSMWMQVFVPGVTRSERAYLGHRVANVDAMMVPGRRTTEARGGQNARLSPTPAPRSKGIGPA